MPIPRMDEPANAPASTPTRSPLRAVTPSSFPPASAPRGPRRMRVGTILGIIFGLGGIIAGLVLFAAPLLYKQYKEARYDKTLYVTDEIKINAATPLSDQRIKQEIDRILTQQAVYKIGQEGQVQPEDCPPGVSG